MPELFSLYSRHYRFLQNMRILEDKDNPPKRIERLTFSVNTERVKNHSQSHTHEIKES